MLGFRADWPRKGLGFSVQRWSMFKDQLPEETKGWASRLSSNHSTSNKAKTHQHTPTHDHRNIKPQPQSALNRKQPRCHFSSVLCVGFSSLTILGSRSLLVGLHWSQEPILGASTTRTGFWVTLYYSYHIKPFKVSGNYTQRERNTSDSFLRQSSRGLNAQVLRGTSIRQLQDEIHVI